jgi:hypothetical protein
VVQDHHKKLKEKGRGKMGMQLEKTLATAQYATWWAQKFALLLIVLASHLKEGRRRANLSIICFSICQSVMMAENCKTDITMRESPSILKFVKCKEAAREAARRASCASP